MAEMVVEDRSTEPKRFFCHMCNVEINIPSTDFTCPICSNGFVEELPANAATPSAPSAPSVEVASTSSSSNSGSGGSLSSQSNMESLRNDIVSLLNMRNVPNLEITIEPNRRQGNVLHLGGFGGPSGSNSQTGGLTAGGRVLPANMDRLDNVLFDFLQSLPLAGATAEIVTGPGGGSGGNSHMFFMGNPGDYAWGREGLDTIVTQMLNQMETSGPPPLSAQRIQEIPNVQISRDEVDKKIQCSICWDDFKLDETVRKLPCSHLYHENCIVPWLNLHSTCPICRKSLANADGSDSSGSNDENEDENYYMDGGSGSGSNSTTATDTTANNTSNSHQSPANPAQQQQQQSSSRNNVFTFDDDNMFLD